MKTSVCITVFNEEDSIEALLVSLVNQTKKPDEIIVVDGGSKDETTKIVEKLKKKHKIIKLIVKKSTRAAGRNISVKSSKNKIIVVTDADCVAKKDWLEKITKPFIDSSVDVVAGFYEMRVNSVKEKVIAQYLGVLPEDFDKNTFLASTRSIAFRKSIWEEVGGFPERKDNSAEDTDFNYLLVNAGINIAREKGARVIWKVPSSLIGLYKKLYSYAVWDARYGKLYNPAQGIDSHNIKIFLKVIRYTIIASLLLIYLSYGNIIWLYLFFTLILFYSMFAGYKSYKKFHELGTYFWGVGIQYLSDIAGILGFFTGIVKR